MYADVYVTPIVNRLLTFCIIKKKTLNYITYWNAHTLFLSL